MVVGSKGGIPETNHGQSGLWAYSPYLRGVGLAEALDFAHICGMFVMDVAPGSLPHSGSESMEVDRGAFLPAVASS